MNQSPTFGELVRRLRRGKKWSLGMLAEQTGLSYSYLSRVENDSASPGPNVVARLGEALDGDLRGMLELAGCLPRAILERIEHRMSEGGVGLMSRSAGSGSGDELSSGPLGSLITGLALLDNLTVDEARRIADAVECLVRLPKNRRSAITALILSEEANSEDA